MKCFVLLTVLVFASKNENDAESVAANSGENIMENAAENSIVVKIEEDEYVKKSRSKFIGVSYNADRARWRTQRRSKNEKKMLNNGAYKDEERAAHASDTLARKLIASGEVNHKLNFPDDHTEVNPEKKRGPNYIGLSYDNRRSKWTVKRWSKMEKKEFRNGVYKDEIMAAHASDTLARKLIDNGEEGHKLNFPDDKTEVCPNREEKATSSKYFGVSYNEKLKKWIVQRWSKIEKKLLSNGYHKDEETAAHASDTLVRKLIANGEQNHKLNFPDNSTKENSKQQTNKRKRSFDFDSEANEDNLEKFEEKEK